MAVNALRCPNMNTYRRTAEEISGYAALEEMALDLSWSWNHTTDAVWRQLDSTLWEMTHNPWIILQTVSREKLQKSLADPEFRSLIDNMLESKRTFNAAPGWFQNNYPKSALTHVAYFSMEFMLSEALPIYSGGLGNVAGDQLKSASDLDLPVIAIGLLYQQGYFRQVIDGNGAQIALYPYNDPGQLPIMPLRRADGEWLRLEIALPGYSIWIKAWQVKVGRVHLFLLDSNDAANVPAYRGITSELYGGSPELRLKQEMILGITGWRLLNELGIDPEVCHLNEGHAAFAVLERARCYMKTHNVSFELALEVTRAGNLFTTHTAVPAGFDRFSPFLMQQHFERYCRNQLGISMADLMALGRLNPQDSAEDFNMAYLAVRGSGGVNGVSRLHGEVSRQIFQGLFYRWPQREVPVSYVTNGVHMPSWDSASSDEVWTNACGASRWLQETEELETELRKISDEKLWQMRNSNRKCLIDYSRNRLSRQLAASGESIDEAERVKHLFDPNILTLGFAPRFAAYKRPNMLLYNPERLLGILNNPQKPVQLIVAGKAHPADGIGQAMIREWLQFIKRPEAKGRVMFLADYDMNLTEHLVQGVDVWINTPRRPWEACGTSGMKVLVNGGLNLSELDGWWVEAFAPELGWALGDMREHGDDANWDDAEANALYALLEREVIPEFYSRNREGIPLNWTARIRESMSRLTPRYSANRSVRQYTKDYYLPFAKNYLKRMNDSSAEGKRILKWRKELNDKWAALRFNSINRETLPKGHFFEIVVYLGELSPDCVKAELFSEGKDVPDVYPMQLQRPLSESPGSYVYTSQIPLEKNPAFFTPRVTPCFQDVAVPLEATHILWP